jgi:dimethylglycine dehydrogenase
MRLVLLEIDSPDADASGYEPIRHEGRRVGYVTSGAYGHHVKKSLALGYVETALTRDALDLSGPSGRGGGFTVSIIGVQRPARILAKPPYDPGGAKLRA